MHADRTERGVIERISSGQPSFDSVLGGGEFDRAPRGRTRSRQDDARAAVRVRQRHAGAPRAHRDHRQRAARQAGPLRPGPATLRSLGGRDARDLRQPGGPPGVAGPGRRDGSAWSRSTTVRPGLPVIDSFRALSAFASEIEYRQFVSELAQRLSATAVTSVWVGEYREDVLDAPEAAVADAIVHLRSERLLVSGPVSGSWRRSRFVAVGSSREPTAIVWDRAGSRSSRGSRIPWTRRPWACRERASHLAPRRRTR